MQQPPGENSYLERFVSEMHHLEALAGVKLLESLPRPGQNVKVLNIQM